MSDYDEYEIECEKIRKANQKLLTEFNNWLKSSGISLRTIRNHIDNIDLYINQYLLYNDTLEARDGVASEEVNMFLDYWFIKKAMWASKSSIKSNATSLKKFYTFLLEKGLVDKEELQKLKKTITENMDYWLETFERYENPDIDIDDVW